MLRRPEEYRTHIQEPEDELYHIASDPLQQFNKKNSEPAVLEHMKQLMSAAMEQLDAPEEQWTRLGLARRS
jgi:hypothetical protein